MENIVITFVKEESHFTQVICINIKFPYFYIPHFNYKLQNLKLIIYYMQNFCHLLFVLFSF